MGVISLADGFHDQLSGFYHTTEEDEGLRTAEGSEVSTGLTKHLTGELVNLLGQFVALTCCDGDIQAGDILWVHFAKQTRTGGG